MKTNVKSPPNGLHPETIDALAKANNSIHKKNKELEVYDGLLQIKKERKVKAESIRPLLLNLGMAISLILVTVAVNWKTYHDGELVDLGTIEADVSEVIDIPISKQPPPPPPKQEIFRIEEVKDTEIVEELEISLDVEVTVDEAVEEVVFDELSVEEEVVDEIFMVVEEEPSPVGGLDAFYAYLSEELRYPSVASRIGVSGMVFVQFVIEKDGSITSPEVVKGIGAGCDEEALRVIKNAPNWNPGKQRGKAVRVKKVIPVRFILKKQ